MSVFNLRERTGLTQQAFANKFHLSIKTVQSWEQGIYKPKERIYYLMEYILDLEEELKKYKEMLNETNNSE